MARKKTLTGVMAVDTNPVDDTAPPVIPDESSAPPSSKREAERLRVVSVKQAATLLGRDRNTIQKWLDQGCPYLTKADRELGVSWELDLGDVVRWLEERAGAAAAAKFGDSEDGKMSEDELSAAAPLHRLSLPNSTCLRGSAQSRPFPGPRLVGRGLHRDQGEGGVARPQNLCGGRPTLSDHVRAIADKAGREMLDTLKTEKSLRNWT